MNVTVKNPQLYTETTTSMLKDFHKINYLNWRFDKVALKKLHTEIKFQQIRFYCKKESPGIVVDIATKINDKGNAVVDFMMGHTDVIPDSCGSYDRLNDDTSTLGRVCYWWNRGLWSLGTAYMAPGRRLYHSTFFKHGANEFNVGTLCDDRDSTDTSGQWRIFVR